MIEQNKFKYVGEYFGFNFLQVVCFIQFIAFVILHMSEGKELTTYKIMQLSAVATGGGPCLL